LSLSVQVVWLRSWWPSYLLTRDSADHYTQSRPVGHPAGVRRLEHLRPEAGWHQREAGADDELGGRAAPPTGEMGPHCNSPMSGTQSCVNVIVIVHSPAR
jgi:hypothetical protein